MSAVRRHTALDNQSISVNLFSHDSDVLAKWNLIVSHHCQVCRLLNIDICEAESELKIDSCRFYRSKVALPPNKNTLGGLAFKRCGAPNTIYDLTDPPNHANTGEYSFDNAHQRFRLQYAIGFGGHLRHAYQIRDGYV